MRLAAIQNRLALVDVRGAIDVEEVIGEMTIAFTAA